MTVTPPSGGLPAGDLVFYDGTCGLCHRWVRFLVWRDLPGRHRFAPIGGATWRSVLPDERRQALPDSIVVRTADGRILARSVAIRYLAEGLGGGWAFAARLSALLPRWLLDAGYDLLARVRRHLFARPQDSCPRLPGELRNRFLG